MFSDEEAFYSGSEEEHELPEVPDPVVTDPEEWQDYWSEELVTLWHLVSDTAKSMGAYVLDACTFSDFAAFCFQKSSGRKPPV